MKRLSKIRAQGDTATVLIYEDIGESFFGGLGAKEFVKQLQALGDVKTINVRINSDGGSVFDGVAIYNALKDHPATINVTVDGIAASIASVIAMAGDTVKMQPTASLMIHNAHCLTAGDCNSLRETADVLEMVNGQMRKAYMRSRRSDDQIKAIMDAETWYSADQAVAAGWADGIVEKPLKMAASLAGFDVKAFKNAPESLKVRVNAENTAQSGVKAAAECTCPCPECLDGDCSACSDVGCDCEGCDCPTAGPDASLTETALRAARLRNENLRLAEI